MENRFKQKTRPRMIYECSGENHLEKNPIQQFEVSVKIKVKLPHVNKKTLGRKRNFVQTPFSYSAFKLERKQFHAAKLLGFSLQFLFRYDQNHYTNLTSKMCEQILKKDSAPIQFKFFNM